MTQQPPVLPEEFEDHVRQALKLWHVDASQGSPIDYLELVRVAQAQGSGSIREATNRVLLDGLKAMEMPYPTEASLLRDRFLDRQMVHVIANRLNLAEVSVYRLQSRALGVLAATLAEEEARARSMLQDTLEGRLQLSGHANLIGVEAHLQRLLSVLDRPGPPFLLSLEGIGGIGKTSLADALVRRCVRLGRVDEIGWVSARHQQLTPGGAIRPVDRPALTAEALVEAMAVQLTPGVPTLREVDQALAHLRAHLVRRSALIVVDNLEAVIDVDVLLPVLRRLADPTRFLLTSRYSRYDESDLFHHPVPELSEGDSLALVRQEARLRNLPDLMSATDAELRLIYETVGGNPLALRLVVGQTHIHGLDTILSDLAGARGETAENLYTFIYGRAWDALDELSRRVLLVMPLVSERGATLEYLLQVSGMDDSGVRSALGRLVSMNLVDSSGGLHRRRYTIHNLTRTFLMEQVIRWQQK